MRGHYSQRRRWLEEALAVDGRKWPESRAIALAGVGIPAVYQGETDRAQEAGEEGLELLAHEASEAKPYLFARL